MEGKEKNVCNSCDDTIEEKCPSCGKNFDYADVACFSGSRGPSYNYFACDSCKKAWLIGTFKMFGKDEIRETKYL